jgi:hypothetical protein
MLDRMPIELVSLDEDPADAGDLALAVGKVTALQPLRVRVAGDEICAKRAISCLVAPEVGDLVLTSGGAGRLYLLSILERDEMKHAELSLPSPDATLAVAAREIELTGAARIGQTAPEIRLQASTLGLFGYSVSLVGTLLTYIANRLHSSVSHQTTVADHVATKARNRVTVVDGTDIQKIGALSQSIDNIAAINADSAIVTARKDVRIDGERISMG